MKQIQIPYTNPEDFDINLGKIASESRKLHCSNILIHIYSSDTDYTQVEALCKRIDKYMPDAKYIGCTTNANILDGHFSESDINLVFSLFEDPSTKIDIMQLNLESYSTELLFKNEEVLLKDKPWIEATEMLVSSYCMMYSNLTEVFAKSTTHTLMFGGGAYTGDRSADSYVFSKGNAPDSKGIVFVLYGGGNLHISTKSVTGWKPLGHEFEITSADKNILKELNGKPAFDIYSKYLNIENNEYFEDNAIEFPLMCTTADGQSIMRTPISSLEDGSIVMFSEVDSFSGVRLAYGDRRNIMECIRKAAEEICEFRPNGIMLFSCVARRSFWHEDIDRESILFQSIAPTSGFFTSGEVLSSNNKIYHHNETLVIVGIREGDIDENRPKPVLPEAFVSQNYSLNSRLVQFISTATAELEETNRSLDKMVIAVDESRRQAEAANVAKSDFLANMSHEIRTPINAILGFDTMILRESGNDAINKYANDIMRAGSNLLAIINDILDLSKIESGKMDIIPVEYEVSSLILDVVNMMSMKAAEKGLTVNLEVDNDIPAWLYGDDVRIRQIIINLMNNAVKYTETGTVTLSIHGDRNGKYETLHISVKDTGIGIKPEDMNKLFEKFSRIEEARNHSVEGTGLGMNITINLLAMMNSKLKVESEYTKGSVFSFDIVQVVVRDEPIGNIRERVIEREDETAYTSSFTAPDAEILVVDDNQMNREVILGLLKHTGIHFDQADGGLPCISMTEKHKYDLILLDHMMPDLDGIKTLHRIRESESNLNISTPIICMTANAITGAQEEYIWEGFDSYISKPVQPEKLENLIAGFLPPEKVLMAQELQDSIYEFKQEAVFKALADNDPDIPEIDGIDRDLALSNLMTPELVLSSMNIIADSYEHEAKALEKSYGIICGNGSEEEINSAVDEYRIKVHSMKSSSLTIGAVMVSNLAKFLEYSARDHRVDNILKVTEPFLEEWRNIGAKLKTALKKDTPPDDGLLDFNPESVIIALSELSTAIQNMDIDKSDEIIVRLKKYRLPDVLNEQMDQLEEAVTQIDVDAVNDITTLMMVALATKD